VSIDHDQSWSWIDWYRFARETLRLEHVEAANYANARHLEDLNRATLRGRRAA
jgi:hypothetical protein